MRPILALAILLLGLMLGLTAAVSEVKFGTTAAVQILPAKMQDRVPAVDEAQPSADVETTGSIGKVGRLRESNSAAPISGMNSASGLLFGSAV